MMRRPIALRPGAVLLEAIVALTILGSASVALLALARQLSLSVEHAETSERQLREADRLMQAVVLWSRNEYMTRLGTHSQGPWLLEVQRRDSLVFTLALSIPGQSAPTLRTMVHRRPEADE